MKSRVLRILKVIPCFFPIGGSLLAYFFTLQDWAPRRRWRWIIWGFLTQMFIGMFFSLFLVRAAP